MTDTRVLIGIDLGTTNLKVAAFDSRDGTCLTCASRRLPLHAAPDGAREQDPQSVRTALSELFTELRTALATSWEAVGGIGLAAQGGSAIIADRETGACHTPMMLWNDTRPLKYLADIARRKTPAYWRTLAWRDNPGAGLARMQWLRERHPDMFCPANIYVGAGEYAYFLMTGVWRQDACNALQIGCYDVEHDRVVGEPLDVVDVPLDFVAPLRRGHEQHGLGATGARLLGLPEGVAVAGPYIDHEAGYMSAAAVSRHPLQCSLGTAWVGNFVLPHDVKGWSPVQLAIPAPIGDGRLVIQPLLTGNVTWDWGLTTLVDDDLPCALSQLDGIFGVQLLPPEGLLCLPWFRQANNLVQDAVGAGAFFGLQPHTTREDLLRALALAMACEFTRIFEPVKAQGHVDGLVLGGGGSKGEFFRTLLTALFDPLPAYALADEDLAGARGATYAFAPRVAQAQPRLLPRPDQHLVQAIRRRHEHYLRLFEQLYRRVPTGGAYAFPDDAQRPATDAAES